MGNVLRPNEIDEVLADPAIDALNLVRNLLVCNSGIVDKIHPEAAAGTPAPSLATQEELLLDGALVARLVGPVLARGMELIRVVNQCSDSFPLAKAVDLM